MPFTRSVGLFYAVINQASDGRRRWSIPKKNLQRGQLRVENDESRFGPLSPHSNTLFFFCSSLTNFRLFFCFFFLLFFIVIPWFPLSFLLSGLWVCSQIEKRKFFKILQKVRQKERLTLFWVCITRAGHQRLMKNNCQDFYHFFHLKKLSLLN